MSWTERTTLHLGTRNPRHCARIKTHLISSLSTATNLATVFADHKLSSQCQASDKCRLHLASLLPISSLFLLVSTLHRCSSSHASCIIRTILHFGTGNAIQTDWHRCNAINSVGTLSTRTSIQSCCTWYSAMSSTACLRITVPDVEKLTPRKVVRNTWKI